MFDFSEPIEVGAQIHPLRPDRKNIQVPHGATVAQIVAQLDLDPRYGVPFVVIARGGQATPVPLDMWASVRPKPGTQVLAHYQVEGAAIGALLASAVSAAAPAIVGTLFPALTGFGFSLAVAAVTVVGGLLVNALIPPPSPPQPGQQDPAQFSITGSQNAELKYGKYPKAFGRIFMFPPKTTRGFTETVGEDIYFRCRYTFGYGPVALSEIKIGTTPITAIPDIEVEFLNVDQALTEAADAGLAARTVAYRTGTEAMTLCSDDVVEDPYSVALEQNVSVAFNTRDRSESAAIDLTFPQGLFQQNLEDPARRETITHEFQIDYKLPGAPAFTTGETLTVTSSQNSQFRATQRIVFPAPGEYEVRITQTTPNTDESHFSDSAFLTAIRSFRAGELPSFANVAEIAIRAKATDQLNGQIDTLNAVVQQLAPVWDGSTWSAPQPVRHPAWVFADALRGNHLETPIQDSRIDADEIKAWADEEPFWTCDFVNETDARMADILDIICATGRAKKALTDLQYSVTREKPADPVRQIYTPRNSWGFQGSLVFPKEVHALRCRVRSERLEWEQDEVIVYADGYDSSNATVFETLPLPGVVVTAADADEGNVYRLGRYHLAVSRLRPETFSWYTDFEHLQVQRGDIVRLVHDVPLIGVGQARIEEFTAVQGGTAVESVKFDERFDIAQDEFRISHRAVDGTVRTATFRSPGDPGTRLWQMTNGTLVVSDLTPGDLVAIERTELESFDCVITRITPGENETAKITAVPRAIAVTQAADGVIPPYDPGIAAPTRDTVLGPASPILRELISDGSTAELQKDGVVRARIGVILQSIGTPADPGATVEVRWRPTTEQSWSYTEAPIAQREIYTGVVLDGVSYEVEGRTVGSTGRTRGWVAFGSVLAQLPVATPLTPVWDAADTSDGIERAIVVFADQVTVRWENPAENDLGVAVFPPRGTEVWRGAASPLMLDGDGNPTNATLLDEATGTSYVDATVEPQQTYFYWLRAVGVNGDKSPFDAGRQVDVPANNLQTIPAVPQDLSCTGYFQQVRMIWDPVTQNTDGSPITDLERYNIYRNTSDDYLSSEYAGSSNGTSFTDTGLADNTTYFYWVTAQDLAGNESGPSLSDFATTNFISADQMVADILDQIGAQGFIQTFGVVPPPAGFAIGQYVIVGRTLYRREDPGQTLSGWSTVYGDIAANFITAAMIQAGVITADKMAVNQLAAITANLGAVTAGSINTLSNGTGVQINIPSLPKAAYVFQNSASVYAMYAENDYAAPFFNGAGGAMYVESRDGFTLQVVQTDSASGNTAIDAQNDQTANGGALTGGQGQVGLSLSDGGYAFNAARGGYFDSSGDGYGPFTGSHQGMILKNVEPEIGDILCDKRCVVTDISDSFTELEMSKTPEQPSAVGVYSGHGGDWNMVAAFIDKEQTKQRQRELAAARNGKRKQKMEPRAYKRPIYKKYAMKYNLVKINSVGEGGINVCGRGGDIEIGDLIITSDMPGKGMKQADDVVRSYTVAKARERVEFKNKDDVQMIACIYLCG